MSRICPQCGAENRDSAKFCLKCAHQMVPLSAMTEPAALEPRKRRRKHRPKAQPEAPRGRRVLLGAAVLIAVLAGLGLCLRPWGGRADPSAPAATPAPALAAAQAMPSASAPELAPAPESAALAQAAAALEQLQTQSSAMSVASSASSAHAAGTADAVPTAKPPPRRRPAKASPEPAPAPPPAPVVVQQAPEPPAPAPVLAPRPAPPRELCADKSFVAKGYCMQTECDKPGMGSHPQCVRMREQQDAMRHGSGEG